MLTWPAVIKYIDEDELTFIENEKEWLIDSDLSFHSYMPGDQVIDSSGELYDLPYDDKEKEVKIIKTTKSISLQEFELIIKSHMVSLNQCCSAKIKLSSFKDGVLLVAATNV